MVLITPRLVRALDPDEVPPLPTRFKPFLGGVGKDNTGKDFEGTGPVDAPDQAKPQAAADKADKNSKKKSGGH